MGLMTSIKNIIDPTWKEKEQYLKAEHEAYIEARKQMAEKVGKAKAEAIVNQKIQKIKENKPQPSLLKNFAENLANSAQGLAGNLADSSKQNSKKKGDSTWGL